MSYSLISDFQGGASKKKYQIFEVELGFEKAKVLIPFEVMEKFEQVALEKKPKSISGLKRIVEQFGGIIE